MTKRTSNCKHLIKTYIQSFRRWVTKSEIERYIKSHNYLAETGNRILRKLTQNNMHQNIEKKQMKGQMHYKWFK